MNDTFMIVYLYRQSEKMEYFNDWKDVLEFIDRTENIDGGYVIQIYMNNVLKYLRILDHDFGQDSWTNYRGKEVELKNEFRSAV